MSRMHNVKEAGERWGISEKTVWKWVAARRISVYRIGRSVRISDAEINRVLEEGFTPARTA